jgi:hypothetical protein
MERAHRSGDRLARPRPSINRHSPYSGPVGCDFPSHRGVRLQKFDCSQAADIQVAGLPSRSAETFCSAIDQGAPLLSSSVAMCHGLPIIWGGRCPQPGYQRQLRRLGYAPRSFIPRRVSVLTVRNGAIALKKSAFKQSERRSPGPTSGVAEACCLTSQGSARVRGSVWRVCGGSGRWRRGGTHREHHWARVIGADRA